MVSNIVGNYLIKRGVLSREQFEDLLVEQKKVHVKLGLIAVAEGLMMQDEADRINRMQASVDKRFGDIAIEEGYLTLGQAEMLLSKQRNAYLAIAQVLQDQNILTVNELEDYMMDFQMEHDLTISDMEDLKSDDVDRILPLYMPKGCDKYLDVAGTALRMIMRCVDTEFYLEKAYIAQKCEADNGAVQYAEGDRDVSCAMAGKGQALLPVACTFGREEFEEVNEDALDAVGELLNCMIGLYSSSLSQNGVSTELYPPDYSAKINEIISDEMLVLPLHLKGQEVDFLISLDNKIEMKWD